MKNTILAYLRETYHPTSILLYGSYASGTNDSASDFDCLLIVPEKLCDHDDAIVAGVQLDCFLYTKEDVLSCDIDTFLTVYEAEIVLDDGTGAELQSRVREYIAGNTGIEKEDREFLISWMKKTCTRIRKGDDEGCFRAVSLLAESLEDYCSLRGRFYFGSKKTIALLKREDPEGYALFHAAVTERSTESILRWVEFLTEIPE